MKVFITLDFELFLGVSSGTVEKCLVDTGSRLMQIAARHEVCYTFLVDTTYLARLSELSVDNPNLKRDYEAVTNFLQDAGRRGHSLQLHIHPQWAYSTYSEGKWHLDDEHYKLSDITTDEANGMVRRGVEIIRSISGRAPIGFRAGGFSAQPTDMLVKLMTSNGIKIDTSVYPGNTYHSRQQSYDYAAAPEGLVYEFTDDICVPQHGGRMLELPLSTAVFSPLFYWKLVFNRLTHNPKHRRLGDGISVKTTGSSILSRLTHSSRGFATIDESKIDYLPKAYRTAKKAGKTHFCVIGHPKLATEYSLTKLDKIIEYMKKDGAEFCTLEDIQHTV